LDRTLGRYLQWCFDSNRPLADVRNVFWGLLKLNPELAHRLDCSFKVLRAVEHIRSSVPYTPFTWNLAVLVAMHLAYAGHARHAVCVLLSFDCYLRISEAVSLSRKAVFFGAGEAQLSLWNTKTGKQRVQYVKVRDRRLVRLLSFVDSITPPGQLFFPGGATHFRRLVSDALCTLGLHGGGIRLSNHSLRHGGATRDWMAGDLFQRIVDRGRWRSPRSAKRYLQEARALLLALQMFPDQDTAGRLMDADCEVGLRSCLERSAVVT